MLDQVLVRCVLTRLLICPIAHHNVSSVSNHSTPTEQVSVYTHPPLSACNPWFQFRALIRTVHLTLVHLFPSSVATSFPVRVARSISVRYLPSISLM